MRKIPSLVLSAALLATGMFAGCGSFGSGGGGSIASDNTGSSWSGVWDTSYSLSSKLVGTTAIIVNSPTSISSYCSTLNGSAVLKYDTSLAGPDTTIYRVQGNKLMIGGNDTNTLGGGTKIVYWSLYTRSSGSGVSGTWTYTFAESLEVVGTAYPADSLQKRREQDSQYSSSVQQAGVSEQVTISSSSVHIQMHYANFAKYEAAILSSVDLSDGYYSFSIQATSPTTLVYIGNVNHEVVTETFLSRTTMRYSSSDSTTHPTYTVYGRPADVSQCPANAWISTFMSANRASLLSGRTLTDGIPATVRRNPSNPFELKIAP